MWQQQKICFNQLENQQRACHSYFLFETLSEDSQNKRNTPAAASDKATLQAIKALAHVMSE